MHHVEFFFPGNINGKAIVPYYLNNANNCIGNISGTDYIYQGTGAAFTTGTLEITIEYTKTTD